MSRCWRLLLLLLLALLAGALAAGSRPKRFVAFRKGSSFFYRLNYKVNALPHSTMFAQASGFKVGWKLPEAGRASSSDAAKLSADEVREGAQLLYHRQGLDGQACLTRSLCQTMQLLSKRDGVLARVLSLMAGSDGASNSSSPLDPLVCGDYADHCPLRLLGFGALAQH